MSNLIKLPLVISLAVTVSACDMTHSDETASQRDVYKSLEDCVADWGDTELCERQLADAKAEAEKKATQSDGGSSVAFVPLFFGPSYNPSDRSVYRGGERYTPNTTKATSTATYFRNTRTGAITKPATFSSPSAPTRPSFSSPSSSVSRGGFGATGSSSSSGS